MGNILGENFDPSIKKQIEVRQKYFGDRFKNYEYIAKKNQLLYANTPFIKLCSSVNLTEEIVTEKLGLDKKYANNRLAKEFILFSGTSTESTYNITDDDGNVVDRDTDNILRAGLNNNKSILGNQAYGLGGLEFGQVPLPGITDLKVSHKNRGSLREAQINLKAYNQKQFDILDILYLRLGYTVLLEWGHSQYLNNEEELVDFNSNFSNDFLEGKITDYFQALQEARVGVLSNAGNYDVMVGKVTNFNWSFNPDGSYDINITVISIGDVIESLKIDTLYTVDTTIQRNIEEIADEAAYLAVDIRGSSVWCTVAILKPDGSDLTVDDYRTHIGPMPSYLGAEYYDANTPGTDPALWYISLMGPDYHDVVYAAKIYYRSILSSYAAGTTPIDPGSTLTATDLSSLTSELGKKFKSIIDSCNSYANNSDWNDTSNGKIRYHKGFSGGDQVDFFRLKIEPSTGTTFINKYYIRLGYLLSILQNNVIFKYKNGSDLTPALLFDNGPNNYFYINQFSYGADLDKAISRKLGFEFYGETYNLIDIPNTPLQKEYGVGNLMNVFLNIDYLAQSLVEGFSSEKGIILYDFLKTICDGINSSFGGVNQLEPVIDELENRVYLLDSTPLLLGKDREDKFLVNKNPALFQIYAFEPTGGGNYNVDGSFIKDINIKSEITNNLATQLSIGAQAIGRVVAENATGLQSWNNGITDRLAPQKVDPTGEDPTTPDTKNYDALIDEIKQLLKKYEDKTITQDEIASLIKHNKTTQKQFSARLSQRTLSPSAGMEAFIPINLNLTMFGLSGMKIYQTFLINSKFLPTNYEDKLKFLIKKINHDITPNGWETNIQTLVTPRMLGDADDNITTISLTIEPLGSYGGASNNSTPNTSGIVTGPSADFWSLIAIVILEDSDYQGRADVAQSIYNRVASPSYANSLAEVIKSNGQYEPAFEAGSNTTAPAWKAINDLDTTIDALIYSKVTRGGGNASTYNEAWAKSEIKKAWEAIMVTNYQAAAASFVEGRTDFLSITQGDVAARNAAVGAGPDDPTGVRGTFVMRSTDKPNNVFGWAYNYTDNITANFPHPGWYITYNSLITSL